ncbi:MAG: hypothetical protein ABJG88_07130 [Litorimonas sp.]
MSFSNFAGDLPEECPPADAVDVPEPQLLRLVEKENPTEQDFLSFHDIEGKVRTNVCKCMSFGVSYFSVNADKHYIADLTKLPKLKKKRYIATVNISAQDGAVQKTDPNKNGHYCFWRKKSFDPLSNISEVKPV